MVANELAFIYPMLRALVIISAHMTASNLLRYIGAEFYDTSGTLAGMVLAIVLSD